jgi:glycosyltransferase involved in cell wall biosynthesis
MSTISAVVITQNEQENVIDCLRSLEFVNEIVVVDNCSSDRTLELAAGFTDKVFSQPISGFHDAKNFGIAKATGDWILSIDSDERVTAELAKEIRQAAESGSQEVGFFMPRKNFLGVKWLKHGGQYPDFQLRLFRKGKGKFASVSVHERVEVEGNVGRLENALLHYTYRDLSDFLRKIDRYTTLEAEQAGDVRGVSAFDLVRLPARKFVSTYFLKKGYRDGVLGMAVSGLTAFYVFVKLAKVWEKGQVRN